MTVRALQGTGGATVLSGQPELADTSAIKTGTEGFIEQQRLSRLEGIKNEEARQKKLSELQKSIEADGNTFTVPRVTNYFGENAAKIIENVNSGKVNYEDAKLELFNLTQQSREAEQKVKKFIDVSKDKNFWDLDSASSSEAEIAAYDRLFIGEGLPTDDDFSKFAMQLEDRIDPQKATAELLGITNRLKEVLVEEAEYKGDMGEVMEFSKGKLVPKKDHENGIRALMSSPEYVKVQADNYRKENGLNMSIDEVLSQGQGSPFQQYLRERAEEDLPRERGSTTQLIKSSTSDGDKDVSDKEIQTGIAPLGDGTFTERVNVSNQTMMVGNEAHKVIGLQKGKDGEFYVVTVNNKGKETLTPLEATTLQQGSKLEQTLTAAKKRLEGTNALTVTPEQRKAVVAFREAGEGVTRTFSPRTNEFKEIKKQFEGKGAIESIEYISGATTLDTKVTLKSGESIKLNLDNDNDVEKLYLYAIEKPTKTEKQAESSESTTKPTTPKNLPEGAVEISIEDI